MILVVDGPPVPGKLTLARSLVCNYFVDAVTLRDEIIAITGTKLSVFNSKDVEEAFKREPFYFHTGLILIRLEDFCIH